MRNKFGQAATVQELWGSCVYPSRPPKLVNLLEQKAHNVFSERMAEALERGDSEEEQAEINACDVKLTVWDVVYGWLSQFRVVTFVETVVRFLTEEPDYSGIMPF